MKNYLDWDNNLTTRIIGQDDIEPEYRAKCYCDWDPTSCPVHGGWDDDLNDDDYDY